MTPHKRRNLLIFCTIAISSGWIGYGFDRLTHTDSSSGNSLGAGIWLVLPLLCSLILRGFGGDGWHNAGFGLRLRGHLGWYGFAIIIFPAVTLLVLGCGLISGAVSFTHLGWGTLLVGSIAQLGPQLLKNFFEESAWRGYLTGTLLATKCSDVPLYLLIGFIWTVWHIPYYLFFLPEEIFTQLGLGRFLVMGLSFPIIFCWTIFYTEIYRATFSIWPLVLAHSIEDAFLNPLITSNMLRIAPGMHLMFNPVFGSLSMLIFLAVGLWLRHRRITQSIAKQ